MSRKVDLVSALLVSKDLTEVYFSENNKSHLSENNIGGLIRLRLEQ